MGFGHEPVEVGHGAEHRVDPGVIGDVVAAVEAGRRIDRREPERVDAETARPAGEVVQVLDDPREVAESVAVRVGKAAWIDLVDHPGAPPAVGASALGARHNRNRSAWRPTLVHGWSTSPRDGSLTVC